MGRQFESLISEAPGFLSRRNAIALIAMAAGSIVTLQAAVAGYPGTVRSDPGVTVTLGGTITVNGIETTIAAESDQAAIVAALAAASVVADWSVNVTEFNEIEIVATDPSGSLEIVGTGDVLASIGIAAGTYLAVATSPEGFRPFSAGDGDDVGLMVAVLMADAAALEEAVFVDRLAEVKAAKIVIADAARAEAVVALEKQNIAVR